MSTTIEIKCFSCSGTFAYYFTIRRTDEPIKCPYCYTCMDARSADEMLNAAGCFEDANADLWKRSVGYDNVSLFQFNLISTTPDKFYEENKRHDTDDYV